MTAATFEIEPPPGPSVDRDAQLVWARSQIARVREWVKVKNQFGRGIELTHTLADVWDRVARELFAWVDTQVPGFAAGVTLVAQGGYGRGNLCLHSDVDLLFLVDDETPREVEQGIQLCIQSLWDLDTPIGHSVKNVPEALRHAGEDFVQMTALFEARPIVGKPERFETLRAGLRQRLNEGGLSEFLARRIDDMFGRHAKYGNTVYLLEPNVKEGEGGLRDIHMCQWIAFACLGSGDLQVLADSDVITPDDVTQMRGAWDFLLVVRNALHALGDRRADTLDFSRQRAVARALSVDPTATHQLAEEHLLHLLHRHARTVNQIAERVVRILPRRSSDASAERRGDPLPGGWIHFEGEIAPSPDRGPDLFQRDPSQMLEICAVARERGLRLSDETRQAIREAVHVCDEEFREDPANRDRFLRILRGPAHTAATIRAMADCDLLAAHIPEWSRIQAMVRVDQYHRYTVDEHTLKCLEVAEALVTDQLADQERGLTRAAHEIGRWDLLMFGLLLHDIGKGEGRGHVVRGGQIATRVAQRMGLSQDESELLRDLVLGHLLYPLTAFRRDLSDPELIRGFAKQIGNVERLTMLFVLTFADITGVHSKNWTAWKGQMIWTLHEQTRRALEGTPPERQLAEMPSHDELVARVLEHLDGTDNPTAARARRLIAGASPRYRLSTDPERMATHVRLLAQITATKRAVWEIHRPELCNHSEITVATVDEPGVFSLMCGALASKSINILSAEGHSIGDGHAIEVFQVQDARGGPLPEGFVTSRIEAQINSVLLGKMGAEEAFPVRLGPPAGTPEQRNLAPTQVEFDNEVSNEFTVLDVRTADRTGLLHAITTHLSHARLMIYLALITTEAYRAVDVFYVTDLDHLKIDDPKRLARLRDELLALLGESI